MSLPAWLQYDALARPAYLLLLIPVGILLYFELRAGTAGAVRVSTGEVLASLRKRRTGWLVRLPAALRALGLALLVVALAGPLHGFQIRQDRENVVDIMLCVDVSGSMLQKDFAMGGYLRDRLYVTKQAVLDFIDSRRDKAGQRYGMDRVGLVLYAGLAWTQCPLTLDYAVLERELHRAEVDITDKRKDGTAIGSALGLAVRRLARSEAKSKVVVLLTDGLNNRGRLDPATAAQLAARFGIRVYTIGAGTAAESEEQRAAMFGRQRQPIDEDMLRRIAELTDAKYFRATDTGSMQEAYREINALEATEIGIGDYYEFKEAFVPFALAGGLALLTAMLSRRKWFDPIP